MKRSEIVKIIQDMLPDSDDYADAEEKEDMAECILFQLEKAGMMPPRSGCEEHYDGKEEVVVPTYAWDSE